MKERRPVEWTADHGTTCDTCGRWFLFHEFVETIEEMLCESCASGIDPDEPDEDDCDMSYWGNPL